MFSPKYNSRYLDDYFNRQCYGARLKLKKFELKQMKELQTLSCINNVPLSGEEEKTATGVSVNDVSFHYKSFTPVLNKLSLQVPQGKIFALLGASGCGKTTLLRMLLGRLKPLSGKIKVFGHEPGSPQSNLRGRVVGYMPQELALFHLLNIEEMLHYYGRIYGMDTNTIDQKVDHLITFLDLPTKERKVSQLSGGQQRRVSLAVTLIHEPHLLILDEPTVGVDSLLRCRIWNYLENLCKNHGTTVLITTHYTEEARNAFQVGFMDSGSLLAQDNPERLILKYNCNSLEDVFLELCLHKNGNQNFTNGTIPEESEEEEKETEINNNEDNTNERNGTCKKIKLGSRKCSNIEKKLSSKRIKHSVLSVTNMSLSPSSNSDQSFRHSKHANRMDKSENSCVDMLMSAGDENSCRDYLSRNRLTALLNKNYILFKRNPVSIILLKMSPLKTVTLFPGTPPLTI